VESQEVLACVVCACDISLLRTLNRYSTTSPKRPAMKRPVGSPQTSSVNTAKLASLPGTLGRARPELRPDLRSFPYRRYMIFFRYVGDVFEVVNILEAHRDMGAFFRARGLRRRGVVEEVRRGYMMQENRNLGI
jgi:hypothetical protein